MDRLRIKICCIADAAEARLAARAGADMIGLVGPMPDGPGIVDHPTAARIAADTPPWTRAVLLTAAETADTIAADAAAAGVDTVQVVRHVDPAESARLAQTGLGVLQVIHVEGPEALDLIPAYAEHADAFLLDSGRPSSDGSLGGTGRVHDWRVSRAFVEASPLPVFLAGGLSPENAAAAVGSVRPFGLDICSIASRRRSSRRNSMRKSVSGEASSRVSSIN